MGTTFTTTRSFSKLLRKGPPEELESLVSRFPGYSVVLQWFPVVGQDRIVASQRIFQGQNRTIDPIFQL